MRNGTSLTLQGGQESSQPPQEKVGDAKRHSEVTHRKNNKTYSEINDGKWEDYSLCRRQTLSVSYVTAFNPHGPRFTEGKVEAQRK